MGELVILCEDGNIVEMRKNQEDPSDEKRRRPLYWAVEIPVASES